MRNENFVACSHFLSKAHVRPFILGLTIFFTAGCNALTSSDIQPATSAQSKAVVFDIDGTLTPTVNRMSDVRVDAVKAVKYYAEKGYKIIYISARFPLYQSDIPKWLKQHDFPDGALHVPTALSLDWLPFKHASYKAYVMSQYQKIEKNWQLVAAYGDSSSDFVAYDQAKIAKDRVFALQREDEASCQPDKNLYVKCLKGWTEHLEFLRKKVLVSQVQ